jgi:RimJ/RimL family protein N-acetyltransferase
MTEIGAVFDKDEKTRLAEYLSDMYGEQLLIDPATTEMIIGYSGSELVFVAGFHNYRASKDKRPLDIELALAILNKRKITKACAKAVCRYPFITLKVPRMTATISATNENSMLLAERHGWVKEGVKRKAGPNGDDIVIWGLLRDECKFLGEVDR